MIPVVVHAHAGPGERPAFLLARLVLTSRGVLEDVSPTPYRTAREAQDAAEAIAAWTPPIQFRIYKVALPEHT